MKTLYLLRHARSDHPSHISRDADRPLAVQGEQDAAQLAGRLSTRMTVPDLILSSPALRARQTAEAIVAGLGRAADSVRLDPQIYLAGSARLLSIVRQLSDALNSAMLVAHNPALTDLSNELCSNARIDHIPSCGLVELALPVQCWSEVKAGSADLIRHDFFDPHEVP